MEIKICRKCNVELIVGENWLKSQFKCKNYICRGCQKEYNKENKEKMTEYNKEYYEKNKDNIKENTKEYRENNKEKMKEYSKEYNTKPEIRKKINERVKLRRRNDPWFDAQCKLRRSHTRLIKNLLDGKDRDFSAVRDLGCTKEVFLAHIESQFQTGMTWGNRGLRGWHYDHIISICEIDPTDKEAVLKVLHYTNLRPLWAVDNIRKGQEDKKKSIRKNLLD